MVKEVWGNNKKKTQNVSGLCGQRDKSLWKKKDFSGKRIDTAQTGNSQNAKNKLINRKHQIKKAWSKNIFFKYGGWIENFGNERPRGHNAHLRNSSNH